MNFTHSSRKSWSLLQRLGASQRPPRSTRPLVSANAVASHLVQVAKAPADKKFERTVRDSWHQTRRNSTAASPEPISPCEVLSALKCMKLGTAPGYDNIHPEFLKHLGPLATTWLSTFFSRVIMEQRIPRTWRQAKVIALQKPGKDPHVAANYRPISLLSVCYKLLEQLPLHSRWAYKLISYHPTTRSLCCLSTVDDRPIMSHLLSRKTATVAPSPKYMPFLYKQEAKLSLG